MTTQEYNESVFNDFRTTAAKALRGAALASIISVLPASLASSAQAAQIDISSEVNANLNTYTLGFVYPPNGGPITIGGINFNLAQFSQRGGTGIVQAAPGPGNTYSFAVNEANVTSVYTIINSAFGIAPTTIATLTFNGSVSSFSYDLTEGDNTRDHATTAFNTSAPNVYATRDFGFGDRLDVQKIVLPAAFGSQTLLSIDLTTTAASGIPNGEAFLAAIATSTSGMTVPLPASAPMFGAGLIALGAAGYAAKRKKAAAAA